MLRVRVRNLEPVQAYIASVPRGVKGEAVQQIADYLIGDERHGLKHYPAYRYVSRRQAYGRVFFSERQRRWFFAALNSGELHIPYRRTFALRQAWEKGDDRWRPVIRNPLPYAPHVMDDERQSRMSRKMGWRTVGKVIEDNLKGALRMAGYAVQRWLKKHEVR